MTIASKRRAPERYTICMEMLFHFRHPDCPAGAGWWSIGDAKLDRAYFCPWCGQQLEPPQSAGAADVPRVESPPC